MPDREIGMVCDNGWGKVARKPKRNSRKIARQQVTGFMILTPLQPQFNGQNCAGKLTRNIFMENPMKVFTMESKNT